MLQTHQQEQLQPLTSIQSLGYKSDLLLVSYQGQLIAHDDVIQAITPDNPTYYWGNLLVFPKPPAPGDLKRWLQRFEELFAAYPEVKHVSIGWDDTTGDKGDIAPFEEAGFKVELLSVMTATKSQLKAAARPHKGVVVRPLKNDQEWAAATQLQIRSGLEVFTAAEYDVFKQKQMQQYREISEAGLGDWYGAFLEGELVGDLGIFHGDGVGRFQSVETRLENRRQGIASALVYEASKLALEKHPDHTLVIVAHSGEPAVQMYEGVGYQTTEAQVGICRRPLKE